MFKGEKQEEALRGAGGKEDGIGKTEKVEGEEGRMRASWGPSVTNHFGAGMVTLSIINYVVHH